MYINRNKKNNLEAMPMHVTAYVFVNRTIIKKEKMSNAKGKIEK